MEWRTESQHNKSFENVTTFKYFGVALSENYMYNESKNRINLIISGECYNWVQNLLFSHLSKNIMIKINTIKFPVWCGCETWSNILREEHRLTGVCKLGAGEDIWAWKGRKWQAAGENCIVWSFMIYAPHHVLLWWMRWVWHVAYMGQKRNVCKV